MPRRAFPLFCLPLLAACPTFAYGPEAFEIRADPQECTEAMLDEGCTRFELDNGTILASGDVQIAVLQLGFRSDFRNLVDLHLRYEIPGQPPLDATCPLTIVGDTETGTSGTTGADETAETGAGAETGADTGADTDGNLVPDVACVAVRLANADTPMSSPSVAQTAEGIMTIEASILASEPGSYALSAWLTDSNGFASPTVRWQFPVVAP